MDTINSAKIMLSRQPFSEFLPYLAYNEEHEIYALDSGLGFVLECTPIAAAGQDFVRVMRGVFEASFPPDTSMQFLLYTSKHVPVLDRYVLLREQSTGDSFYTKIAKQRQKFLSEGREKSILKGFEYKIRDFRLIVSVVVPYEKTPESYRKNIVNIAKIKEAVKQSLNTAYAFPVNMTPESLINTVAELVNPSHTYRRVHYDPKLPIKDQIVFTDSMIEVEKNHLLIDGKVCKSFTVRQYPEKWDISMGTNFIGDFYENLKQLDVPFALVLNCQYPDIVKAKKLIQQKSMAASYQAFGPLGKLSLKLAAKKQNFDDFTMALENNETPFYAYMQALIFADSEKQAEYATGKIMGLFRSINFILQEDTYISLVLFLQALPMCYIHETQRDLRRRKTFTTGNVAELIPCQSDWKGAGEPVMMLSSRRGQIQNFDIFYNPLGGYSGVVVASTGAGKSMFANMMIMDYLGVGAKIWTIDVGRSYEKTCKVLDGDFIVFDRQHEVCLNPFTLVKDIDEEMPILKSIIAQMASTKALDDLSMSFIEESIKENFVGQGKGNKMTVTDVAEFLEKGKDRRQVDIAKMLYPYTALGSYAAFFEGENSFTTNNMFTVLELEELKSKKDLQEVVLLSLLFQIQSNMLDREQRKIVIIDEAWELLSGGNTAKFMENAYRRFRKQRGSCITITQGIDDFYRIPAGEAIISNADFMFLLRQKAESIEALKKSQRVSFTEDMFEILKSVHTDTGNYSEILVYTPYGVTIGRLIVDRFIQLLFTTKPDEYTAIKNYTKTGMTILEAIERVIQDEMNEDRKRLIRDKNI